MPSNVLEIIADRRSVRRYLSKDVSYEVIWKVLEASVWAPSAHNAQPWRYIVIKDPKVKRRLAEGMASEWIKDLNRDGYSSKDCEYLVENSIKQFTEPPILIVACLTMRDMSYYPDERRRGAEYVMAVQSVAASIQNFLLAVHAEGLGACWFCAPLFCPDQVRKILRIPRDVDPQALLTLGYPYEKLKPPFRMPLRNFSFKNHWGIN